MGELRNPSDPASQELNTEDDNNENEDERRKKKNDNTYDDDGLNKPASAKRFTFRFVAAASASLPPWNAVFWRDRLYVNVSDSLQFGTASKEAFVSLLEYAEETLNCSHVVVCLDQGVAGLRAIVRNFLFLGFQPLAPGHEFLPKNPNLVSVYYKGGSKGHTYLDFCSLQFQVCFVYTI